MSYCELCKNHFFNYDLHVRLVHEKKSEYRCRYCGMYFEEPEPLFDHIVALHTHGEYKCHLCHKKTKNLDSHLDSHAQLYVYSCECGRKFSSKTSLANHQCHRCPFCAKHVWDFRHYESHSCCNLNFLCETFFNEHKIECKKQFCIPCYEYKPNNHSMLKTCCSQTLLCRTQYESHLETHKDIFRCFYCDKVFKFKNSLKIHLQKRTCCGENFDCYTSFNKHECLPTPKIVLSQSICEKCGLAFKYKKRLEAHFKKHFLTPKKPNCKLCSKTFANNRELKYHMWRHTGKLNFVCWCGKAFVTNSKLKEHQKTHSAERLVCNQCFKVFKSLQILNIHKKTHSLMFSCFHCGKHFGRKPTAHIRPIECCGRIFNCRGEFLLHESFVDHKYVCDFCGRIFKNRSGFYHHKATQHYEETTLLNGEYSCDVCFTVFSTSHNLMRHKRRKHNEQKIIITT